MFWLKGLLLELANGTPRKFNQPLYLEVVLSGPVAAARMLCRRRK
jgi:hypothetical protein